MPTDDAYQPDRRRQLLQSVNHHISFFRPVERAASARSGHSPQMRSQDLAWSSQILIIETAPQHTPPHHAEPVGRNESSGHELAALLPHKDTNTPRCAHDK